MSLLKDTVRFVYPVSEWCIPHVDHVCTQVNLFISPAVSQLPYLPLRVDSTTIIFKNTISHKGCVANLTTSWIRKIQKRPVFTMVEEIKEKFSGKWKLDHSDNFDGFMTAMGIYKLLYAFKCLSQIVVQYRRSLGEWVRDDLNIY